MPKNMPKNKNKLRLQKLKKALLTTSIAFKFFSITILTCAIIAGGVLWLTDFDHKEAFANDAASTYCPGSPNDVVDGDNELYVANTASVSSTVNDPDLTNNDDCDESLVERIADVAVTKDDGLTQINPGDASTYTITITNNGPTSVFELTVTDTFPTEFENITFATSEGNYDFGTSTLTGIDLAAGESMTISASGNIRSDAVAGTITNTVTVAVPPDYTDPDTTNNTDTDDTDIIAAADLAIDKVLNGSLVAGSQATYTLTVTNNGPSEATDLTVVDTLPGTLTFVSATGTDWTCSESGGTVTCTNPGPLANGATSEITLVVDVADASN